MELSEAYKELSKPFDPKEVELKVQSTSKDRKRGLVVAYVDARAVLDRLDEVVGPGGWSDSYRLLADLKDESGRRVEVACALTVLGITKEDVGEGDTLKAAYSDALKRAAVKFGVGRYLYRLPKVWADLDEFGQIVKPEEVKARLLSGSGPAPAPQPASKPFEPPPSQPSSKATERQLRMIWKLVKDLDPQATSDAARELASIALERDVESMRDLTIEEASRVIDWLQEEIRAQKEAGF